MYTKSFAALHAIRRRPLALCLCTAFAAALSSSALAYVPPDTWTVNTCNDDDSGNLTTRTGSLRFAVTHANGGSTIDLSQLPTAYNCSVITLGTGSIKSGLAIAQNDLTLQGPAGGDVTITERDDVSNVPVHIIDHLGTGTLSVNNLTFANGRPFDTKPVQNGCIYSKGTVALSHSAVCGTTILSSAVASAKAAKGAISSDDIATPEHPYLQSPPVDSQ